jgi:hypothetical protein
VKAALRRAFAAATAADAPAWAALAVAMGGASEPSARPYRGPWTRFINHLMDLDRRRALTLPLPALSWLEAEGLIAFEEERARIRERREKA